MGSPTQIVVGHHRPPPGDRTQDIERQPLQRVIAVGQKAQRGESDEKEVALVQLEFFEGGFIANFRLRGWDPCVNPHTDLPQPGFVRPPIYYADSVDDQGNKHQAFPGNGGGGGGHWRKSHRSTPEWASTGGQLHVTIEDIQWMSHGAGVQTLIEPCPWQFDVPLE